MREIGSQIMSQPNYFTLRLSEGVAFNNGTLRFDHFKKEI